MRFDGGALRRERKAIEVPLDTLAAVSGVSGCWLSKIERGAVEPSAEIVRRLQAGMTMLQGIVMHVAPLRLNLSDVSGIRALIEKMERGAVPSTRPTPTPERLADHGSQTQTA